MEIDEMKLGESSRFILPKLFLLIIITSIFTSIVYAPPIEVMSEQELGNRAVQTFNSARQSRRVVDFAESTMYLFAYIQRKPQSMKDVNYANRIYEAYNFSRGMVSQETGPVATGGNGRGGKADDGSTEIKPALKINNRVTVPKPLKKPVSKPVPKIVSLKKEMHGVTAVKPIIKPVSKRVPLRNEMVSFYTVASTMFLAKELSPGQSLGSVGRDSEKPESHLLWAKKESPQGVKQELITKIVQMVNIKERQGKDKLSDWYALICTNLANYGVDFGSPTANSRDFGLHKKWASSAKMKSPIMRAQIVMRINKIFAHYGY